MWRTVDRPASTGTNPRVVPRSIQATAGPRPDAGQHAVNEMLPRNDTVRDGSPAPVINASLELQQVSREHVHQRRSPETSSRPAPHRAWRKAREGVG